MARTRTLMHGLTVVALLCCTSQGAPPTAAQRRPEPSSEARPEPPVPDAPHEEPPPAALRVTEIPELSPFTPSLVRNLLAIRAASERRQDDVFMKVGDSSTVSRGFLECFADEEEVRLAGSSALAPTVEHFRGGDAGRRDPFRRSSLAAHEGWSARHVLSGNPPPVLAEIRAIRPRFAFVMNGGNDVEGEDDYAYAERMLRIVTILRDNGVIPILNSISPRTDNPAKRRWVERYNQISWGIARALELPYLDYHQVMERLPRQGLAGDGVHPNILLEGGRGHACRFDERGLQYGHNARNLLALRALDALRRTVVEAGAPLAPPADPRVGSGTVEAPLEVSALPFAELRDTRTEGSAAIDAYPSCGAEQDESGNELVYRLVVDAPIAVRVVAISLGNADADVHLLGPRPSPQDCLARADRELVHELTPGTWHVVVDTFASAEGPRAGEVLVLIAPAPLASPPPDTAADDEAPERADETGDETEPGDD